MYSIDRIKLLISRYGRKITMVENNKVYKKDFYRYFINDLEDLKNDIFINHLEEEK